MVKSCIITFFAGVAVGIGACLVRALVEQWEDYLDHHNQYDDED